MSLCVNNCNFIHIQCEYIKYLLIKKFILKRGGTSSYFNVNTLNYFIIIILLLKVKWSHSNPGVPQRMVRGLGLLFHYRDTRTGWVVSSTPRPQFTPCKDTLPNIQEVRWAPGSVWTGGKCRPHRDSILDRPARASRCTDWSTLPTPSVPKNFTKHIHFCMASVGYWLKDGYEQCTYRLLCERGTLCGSARRPKVSWIIFLVTFRLQIGYVSSYQYKLIYRAFFWTVVESSWNTLYNELLKISGSRISDRRREQ